MMAARNSNALRGTLRTNEPMALHTSWRVGGPADTFFRPVDRDDLATFLRQRPKDEPLLWVGLGSNLLVRDGGVRGSVIATHRALAGIEHEGEGVVRVGAGVACAKLARRCAALGLGPAQFFAGIPGTVGGALAMNAGAFGGETWAHVRSVETIDRGGSVRERSADEYEVGYRSVRGPAEEWFLSARLAFDEGAAAGTEAIKELLARRKASQPIGLPSCGSVFRNPPGDHAARLIEAAGLKGLTVGRAQVSPKHANFIINLGEATAADVEALLRLVQAAVAERHGVTLMPEVRMVGEYL